MQTGKPSKTALRVAIRRAAHQIADKPLVLDDPIALRLIGPGFDRDMERAAHKVARDFRAFMAVRSRLVEDELADAVGRGVSQYVILGAGLDTFAWRNPFSGLQVFEVDHPATQIWKREMLERAQLTQPPGLTFVPLDFERHTLAKSLIEAGCSLDKPVFCALLGVVPYLTGEAFRTTLASVARMVPGSGIGLDYSLSLEALSPAQRPALEALAGRVAATGEPFKLLFSPHGMEAELKGSGFNRIEQWDSKRLNQRYFCEREDGLKLSDPGLAMIAVAWV